MSIKTDCQKCGSPNAWYRKTHTCLYITCFCGYDKCVFTTLGDIEIQNNEPPTNKLPRAGTHLYNTLLCLQGIEQANSKEVADTLVFQGFSFTVSDVSSYLMMLRSRQLVEVVDYRRGLPGGSTWRLTKHAKKLFGEPV